MISSVDVRQVAVRIVGAGPMAEAIRTRDWTLSPVGPISVWPDTLVSFVNLILAAPTPMQVLWGSEMLVFYNDAMAPFLVGKGPEVLGSPCRQVWREAWLAVKDQLESVLHSGEPVSLKAVFLPLEQDGILQDMYWDYSYLAIRYANGVIAGILNISQNVTETMLTQQELQASDERLSMALSAANGVGIWDWNIAEDRVHTDANFAKLYGVDPADAERGISVDAFISNIYPDDAERVGHQIDQAIRSGQDFASEYRLTQADGSVRWVFAKGRCSYDSKGRPVRFPGVTVDITERKTMESALRAGEERLRIAVETARLGRWELDLETGEFLCSDLCRRNYGRKPDEPFTYQDQLNSIHPEDRARRDRDFEEAIRKGEPYRCEYRVLWPDETLHWIISSGRVSYDEQGKPLRVTGVSLDVTERHQSYAALMQTEKLAAVGRLAASIAHEINNPLESVTNLLYLARNSDDVADIHEHLDVAERELRRVSVITSQTLQFHRQSSRPKAVTFADLFGSVLSVYQGRLLNSHVQVEKYPRSDHPVLCFDGEIRQVLNNLVGNAIDAMQGAGGRLLLRSRKGKQWSSGAPGMVFTIADTGTGMSRATLKKIFEPFYTTKGIGGTGLGLWVSSEIVVRHHGELRVRSSQRPGCSGTVFTLFLPFEAAAR